MSCTPRTRQCPTAYLARGLPTPPCCRDHVINLLAACTAAFEDAGVHYWLDYGSLLGAVREGGMIEWDNDADIGILASDYAALKSVRAVAERDGWLLRIVRHLDYVRAQLSFVNKLHVCVFVWHDHPRQKGMLTRRTYMRVDDQHSKGKDFPRDWVLDRCRVSWEGISVWAPANPDGMLSHRYGDWRTPVKHRARNG